MKIKGIAPWFGAKRSMAPLIVDQLGPHTCYFEPFCGSCAVLLAKEPSRLETVNDLHGDLINLALVLSGDDTSVALYDRLTRTLMHDEMLKMARDKILGCDESEAPDVDRAYWSCVFWWLGRNGEAGCQDINRSSRLCVRWTPNGGSPTTRFRSAVESIPSWHDRLRNVQILRRDAFDVISSIPDSNDTVVYCDPPYVKKSDEYRHDFSPGNPLFGEPCDHTRLRDALSSFTKTRVVVSYYDDPLIRDLYGDWHWLDCTTRKNSAQAFRNKKGTTEAPEVLLINGGLQ